MNNIMIDSFETVFLSESSYADFLLDEENHSEKKLLIPFHTARISAAWSIEGTAKVTPCRSIPLRSI